MAKLLKVSAKSNPNSVAGALANVLRENKRAEIQAVGAGAINQAIKSIAITRGFLVPSGSDLYCVPAFAEAKIEGQTKTAIKLIVELH
jgi:stage V sporulation protein S